MSRAWAGGEQNHPQLRTFDLKVQNKYVITLGKGAVKRGFGGNSEKSFFFRERHWK